MVDGVAREYQRGAWKMRRFILSRSALLSAMRNAVVQWTPECLLGLSARRFYHADRAMS